MDYGDHQNILERVSEAGNKVGSSGVLYSDTRAGVFNKQHQFCRQGGHCQDGEGVLGDKGSIIMC